MDGISIADAQAIAGAATGAVIAVQSASVGPLTAPQKTALAAFITSLGLSIPSANVVQVHLNRQRGAPGNIVGFVSGLVVPASAAAALNNRSTYDDIVGIVP